ncbi:MAG: ketopantoate reductase family protein [Bacteroidetes bacterium]|nr:ketopantoate reductase family protein [Bacteroidota bacterium]MBL6963187.1 ketopantoate reductase family protein [Bacteroidota bacterium]
METVKYKIGIIGLGPIGQTLAVFFKEAGCEVAVTDLDREKLNMIRKNGIELVSRIRKKAFLKFVYYSIQEMLEHDFDILISAVKDYHVDSILEQIELGLRKKTYLLSAQNGIDIRRKYSSHFDESEILRMVVNFAGNLQAPNVVALNFFNPPNYVGSVNDSCTDISNWIADTLNDVKMETISIDSFEVSDKIWEKTIINAALSPLCAISRLTMKEAMDNSDTLEIVEQILYEAVEVAKAEEIKLPDNFIKLAIRYLGNAGNHMPSLAVDLINKRDTEIDYMNGKIVEYGRKHYIRTPLNLTLTNLVKAISIKNGVRE